ncbi:hypothetical protein E2C01_049148 [Portunus trituberculatus]|uniref:Uncharacterized protein n=1 Tax=Portunus trituberculatus TaxID=210409 RepID=A0A5B7GCE2_PORTR|nr:hypothetical protein [Portunus trituberculatus]
MEMFNVLSAVNQPWWGRAGQADGRRLAGWQAGVRPSSRPSSRHPQPETRPKEHQTEGSYSHLKPG